MLKMKNLLSLLAFSFVTLFSYAQCDEIYVDYIYSNDCLPLATYGLYVNSPEGMVVQWSWQTNPTNGQLLIDQDSSNLASIMMSEVGVYELLIEIYDGDELFCQLVSSYNVTSPMNWFGVHARSG